MIDTIRLHLYCDVVSRESLSSVGHYIDNAHENVDTATGELWGNGTLKNLRIKYSGGYVSVEGSIGGYLFPNNSRIPKRQDVATAIEQLSDTLHLPMGKARVLRLDCGYHWNMNNPVSEYLKCLYSIRYFERILSTPTTLYFVKGGKNETNRLAFYDKGKECRDLHKSLLDGYGNNTLRYECRWLKRLPRQFGVSELFASTLYDQSFYQRMVTEWGAYYEHIKKSHQVNYDMSNVHDVRSANSWLYGLLLNVHDIDVVIKILQLMKEKNVLKNGRYPSLNKSVENHRNFVCLDAANDLAKELDTKVHEVVKNCE
jgi:hypothetical protein